MGYLDLELAKYKNIPVVYRSDGITLETNKNLDSILKINCPVESFEEKNDYLFVELRKYKDIAVEYRCNKD